MNLRVLRIFSPAETTIGGLFINDEEKRFCWTLEDQVRPLGEKVDGKTAIPAGTYRVIIDESKRFGCPMPHILDVPGFEGVRIHSGNTSADTAGCLLVGDMIDGDRILKSRIAFVRLFNLIRAALASEEVWLTIS